MLSIALQLLAAQTALPQEGPRPRIVLRTNEFVLSRAGKTERVPLKPPTDQSTLFWPPEPLLFRKDDAYVVWDVRGLTIRQKDWLYHTWLTSVPTSPRLFTREEILETKELLQKGDRQQNASTLAGAYRDGNDVFLLAKWEDRTGRTWAEALFKVDLTEAKPKPALIGKFDGLSLNLRPGKSALFSRDGKPSVWIRTDDAWGLGSFDTTGEIFEFKRVGERLEKAELTSERVGWFIERTALPSRILYRWDSVTLAKRQLLETPGTIRPINKVEPWIAVVEEDEAIYLQNAATGSRNQLPPDAGYRTTSFGVLVWTPFLRPRSAVLFDPEKWTPRARWSARPDSPAPSTVSSSSLP